MPFNCTIAYIIGIDKNNRFHFNILRIQTHYLVGNVYGIIGWGARQMNPDSIFRV